MSILRRGLPLREKCPNTEFFLVRIFPHLDWIRRDTEKYGAEIIPYLDNCADLISSTLWLRQMESPGGVL